MARIEVRTVVEASPDAVWRRLADIADHVAWMADAATIRFRTDQRTGVGTVFECETRVGPLRTLDVMEVTEWRDRQAMGVRHTGIVTGAGRFVLRPCDRGTALAWDEDLRFPWWLGGSLGTLVGRPVLRLVWRGNLRRLAALVAGDVDARGPSPT